MKTRALYGSAAAAALLLGYGCAVAPHRIDPAGDQTLTSTHRIDVKDWQTAALKSIDSLLASGALNRADGRKTIVMVGEVKNNTSTPVNTRILTDKIRQAILRSGKSGHHHRGRCEGSRRGRGPAGARTGERRPLQSGDRAEARHRDRAGYEPLG